MIWTRRLIQVGYTLAILAVVYTLTRPPNSGAQNFRANPKTGAPTMPATPTPQILNPNAYINGYFVGGPVPNMAQYVNGNGNFWQNGGNYSNNSFINGSVNGPGYMGGIVSRPRSYDSPDQAWADLDVPDDATGRAAVACMVAKPQETLKLLKRHLHPIEPATAKQLDQLVADLDDDSFEVRERATQRLAELGETARPALRRVLAKPPSPETKWRAEDLQRRLDESPSPDRLRSQRTVAVLEAIGDTEARTLLDKLAHGAAGIPQTEEARAALQRLSQKK